MESFVVIPQKENCCPMFCILKMVLFAVIIVFMLFLPLGDPHVACKSTNPKYNARIAMCYLCKGYYFTATAIDKAIQALHFVLCLIFEVLYEAKLKFYMLLERIDKRDLCSSVCCIADEGINSESRETRCPNCKCVRKRCSRRIKSECRYARL